MKKIVLYSAFLSPFRSGAEACAEEVSLALSDQFDFTVITSRLDRKLPKKDMLKGKVAVIRVGVGLSIDKWFFPFLAPLAARKIRPDIVHAVLETFAGVALIFSRFLVPKAKRVLTLQSTNVELALNAVQRSAFKMLIKPMHNSAHKVAAISEYLCVRSKVWGRDDVVKIPNGIHFNKIQKAAQENQKVPKRILFVGRLREMKGVDVLLNAFAKLPSDITLRIVGDGYLRKDLEKQSQDLAVSDRVNFLGWISPDEVIKELAEAPIFCGLSRHEALGNAFIEAQAAGCAVVATSVEAIPEYITDGETGLLVEKDDVDEAMSALSRVLKDDDLRSRLARNAQENAKKFDWSRVANQYKEIYEALPRAS